MPEKMTERELRILRCLLVGIACGGVLLVGLCYLYFALKPHLPFLFGVCPVSRILHLYCPGCGGTRAMKALLRGDLLTSAQSNPMVIWGVVLCIWQYIRMVRGYLHRDRACLRIPAWSWISLIAVILGFFAVRNLLLVFAGYDYLGDNAAFWAFIRSR